MYAIITQLEVRKLDYDKLSKYTELPDEPPTLTYAECLELEAFLRGEKVSTELVGHALAKISNNLCPDPPELAQQAGRCVTIECKDGKVNESQDTIETLCRHFILFRDFFSEYPDKDTIRIDNLTTDEVNSVLNAVLNEYPEQLGENILYALRTLNPISNAYFLFFKLAGMSSDTITSLLSLMTDEEKRSLEMTYRLQQDGENCSTINLPYPCHLAMTSQGIIYLSKEESRGLAHSGWSLACAVYYNNISYACDLIRRGFDKDEFIPLNNSESRVIATLLYRLIGRLRDEKDRDVFILACSMLSLHHYTLGNVDKKVCPPYHLDLHRVRVAGILRDLQATMDHYGYIEFEYPSHLT
jgi:hypothetical protein